MDANTSPRADNANNGSAINTNRPSRCKRGISETEQQLDTLTRSFTESQARVTALEQQLIQVVADMNEMRNRSSIPSPPVPVPEQNQSAFESRLLALEERVVRLHSVIAVPRPVIVRVQKMFSLELVVRNHQGFTSLFSTVFDCGGVNWQLKFDPPRPDRADWGFYLAVPSPAGLPLSHVQCAEFSIKAVNLQNESLSREYSARYMFTPQQPDWGWRRFISVAEVSDPQLGWVNQDGKVKVVARVTFIPSHLYGQVPAVITPTIQHQPAAKRPNIDWEEVQTQALRQDCGVEPSPCSICLSPLNSDNTAEGTAVRDIVLLCCSHRFHRSCLESYEATPGHSICCPNCRREYTKAPIPIQDQSGN
eukprot:TRINITY_DN6042_c0_g1_i3.p1 TRINITY_DN6042_c0_g1~~TRINITY_DN6042_c0_g1_i3.p1  ORF type:complete len:364 (-),score=23.25 TRINITY_DN6042_c0_g1_i3:30-1121(-)